MKLLNYFLGKSQFAPEWFYKLPLFMIPLYDGDKHWRWFGLSFNAKDALAGQTLFMRWRNIIKSKLPIFDSYTDVKSWYNTVFKFHIVQVFKKLLNVYPDKKIICFLWFRVRW